MFFAFISDKADKISFVRSLCLGRKSRGLGKIYYSERQLLYDSITGAAWTTPKATDFLNPNSSVDTVYYDDRLFLVHNPSKDYRYPLCVSELDDSFNVIQKLKIGDKNSLGKSALTSELSYPYMIENDGKLHLTYTYGRSKIEHVIIKI